MQVECKRKKSFFSLDTVLKYSSDQGLFTLEFINEVKKDDSTEKSNINMFTDVFLSGFMLWLHMVPAQRESLNSEEQHQGTKYVNYRVILSDS